MKKRFILLTAIICLSGCSSVDSGSADLPYDSDGSVHVASPGSEYDGVDMFCSLLIEETLYYIEKTSEEGDEGAKVKVLAWPREGEREEVAQFISPEQSFIHFTGDEGGNLYFLYADETSNRIYLQKNAADGSLIYLADAGSFEEMGILDANADERMQLEARRKLINITDGAASGQGQVCFYNVSHNILFLFGSDSAFLGTLEFDGTSDYNSGVVNAGEGGIYAYRIEDGEMLYQKLDWENKSLGMPATLALRGNTFEDDPLIIYGGNPMPSQDRFSVMDGYGQGFLISSSDALWRYDLAEGKLISLLKWTDPYVDLSGDYVEHVSLLDDERVFAIALASSDHTYRQVLIEIKPEGEVPTMQTIILGMTYRSYMDYDRKLITWYNRQSQDYQIEMKYYSLDELYMALLKGEGPDLMELTQAQKDVLASKGILEDLSPYMESSTLVQEDDLLSGIIRNCSYNGKLIFVIPDFFLGMLAVAEKDLTLDMGWTPEEVLGLAEANPDIPIEYNVFKIDFLLNLLLRADMDSFIDWEKKESYFESERFISLLERVGRLKLDAPTMYYDHIHNCEKFLNRECLISSSISIRSVDIYVSYREALEGFGSIVGYPNHNKTPHFIMYPSRIYSINSASKKKEEAWSFLEYLLSEEHQTKMYHGYEGRWYDLSPRKDIFEEDINTSYQERYPSARYFTHPLTLEPGEFPAVTEADKEAMRFIVDNAYLDLNMDYESSSAYLNIICEEVWAFFEGDKSAEEVARIIQSRVSLMVKE